MRTRPSRKETSAGERFRKLMLAMSNDIRVLLVKLADRLHNMRTLAYVKNPDARSRIAQETVEIYAPLAGRIGMQNIREELEDLAFAALDPEARESIIRRMEQLDAQSHARARHRGFVEPAQSTIEVAQGKCGGGIVGGCIACFAELD